ncbi:HSF-type DNA-binding-domain-containing protein [Gloeopeniophorella convolvens]|nr:HSF-type DNA-binding-domain-containing protein [Gloeopeniophorella convolvens]
MADLYPHQSQSSYQPQSPYHRPPDAQAQTQYHLSSPTVVYPPRLLSAHSSPEDTSHPNSPPKSADSASHSPTLQQSQQPSQQAQQPGGPQSPSSQNNMAKSDTKPQATFLTKLYALLERTENHHMIRWDPAGEHIIVERPEQLALHVLPSIYRQSRFASFSRQLNIYGFMRKVNLRNVDPAIDDPDASTWSHPTLNRHSPAEVVANFKRRVPPRLPKPRKRPDADQNPAIPPPRSASGLGTVPLTIPSSLALTSSPKGGRARGFSAPGSYQPLAQAGTAGQWGNTYSRALPPLTVPSDPPLSHGGIYPSSHSLHPISPAEDHGSFNPLHYPPNREVMVPSSTYSYPEQNNWSFSPISSGSSSSHSGSLTSLLNPSNGSAYPPTRPTINTSYPSSLSSVSMQHSASSLSPDSRPATGYSVSSMSSLPYDDGNHYSNEYSRPGSGHHRPLTPTSSRPPSSKSSYAHSTLSVRRQRRHSQAVNPYPTPYEQHMDDRPSSSPQPANGEDHNLHRSRSMIQLPTVDTYNNYGSNQPDFAYSAGPLGGVGAGGAGAPLDQSMDWNSRSVRPSTSASSLSAASQTSSSQAHTPPVTDHFEDTNVHRCE